VGHTKKFYPYRLRYFMHFLLDKGYFMLAYSHYPKPPCTCLCLPACAYLPVPTCLCLLSMPTVHAYCLCLPSVPAVCACLCLPVYAYLSIPTVCASCLCYCLCLPVCNLGERSARSKAPPNLIDRLIGSFMAFTGWSFERWLSGSGDGRLVLVTVVWF
jgi:hypothetical protein